MLAFRTVRPARVTLRAFAHYELPALPWAKNALAPHISEETIDFHYGKHHKTYVDKLNGLTKDSNTPLEELCKTSSGAIFNNAAQIYNHTFYWNSLSPNGGGNPTGKLLEKINQDFGSVDNFKKEFSAAAVGHFGSGWAWLVVDKDGKLKVTQTHDAANPLSTATGTPLLTCDVWEHAYYIDHRNLRPKYLESWWNLVNWQWAEGQLRKAL
eukprot:GEMP01044873.1.p1 GENE.GEMP01044873.1~~GEMP01044873.1.p1  ORF type:complete len:225 (+),score=42.70 GEMP01044873.1:44-676(+)